MNQQENDSVVGQQCVRLQLFFSSSSFMFSSFSLDYHFLHEWRVVCGTDVNVLAGDRGILRLRYK